MDSPSFFSGPAQGNPDPSDVSRLASRPVRRPWPRVVGISPAARQLEFEIDRAAASASCILISGETGCGKEGVARAIHARGNRSEKPFVALNCATLTSSLAESQLFGHVKGAFTGAIGQAAGVFRAADGGVVFLDEIGEMPLELQPKLLRVLQQREVTPVGSTDVFPIDVQILAATNRHLQAEVEKGTFREDLHFRLNTIEIHVPPLRERTEDISLLIRHFAQQHADRLDVECWEPDAATLGRLLRYQWPGNIRQLAQFVERVYVLGSMPLLPGEEQPDGPTTTTAAARHRRPHGMPVLPASDPAEPVLPIFNLDALRRMAVRQALAATGGHKGKAAELLGVHLNTMTKFVAEMMAPTRPKPSPGRPRKPAAENP